MFKYKTTPTTGLAVLKLNSLIFNPLAELI